MATGLPRFVRRLHSFIRRQLWWWATLLALFIVLSWFFGGSAGTMFQWIVLTFLGLTFAWLIWEGWKEWKEERRNTGGAP